MKFNKNCNLISAVEQQTTSIDNGRLNYVQTIADCYNISGGVLRDYCTTAAGK